MPVLPIETGADKAKDVDNSGLMQLPPDLLVAQLITPVSNVDKQDTLLETVCAIIRDVPEQISSTSMINSIPMKNSNLLIRLPKYGISST